MSSLRIAVTQLETEISQHPAPVQRKLRRHLVQLLRLATEMLRDQREGKSTRG